MNSTFVKASGVGAGMIAGLVVLGIAVGPSQQTPEPKVIVKTVIKYKESKVVTKNVLSDACKTALDEATNAAGFASDIYSIGNEQQDILSDARVAIYGSDTNELTKIAERQSALNSSTIEQGSNLVIRLDFFNSAKKSCDQSLESK